MEITRAGTGRTAGGVADADRYAFDNAAELNLKVLILGVGCRRRVLY